MPANLENSAVGRPQNWKWSVFIPIPKKGNVKECSNYYIITLISHASKAMLKILQARLQQYVNCELPDVQAGFRKGRRNTKHEYFGNKEQIKTMVSITNHFQWPQDWKRSVFNSNPKERQCQIIFRPLNNCTHLIC